MRALALTLALACLCTAVQAQESAPASIAFNGKLGSKTALLLLDGELSTVQIGQSVRGVRLISLDDDLATIDVQGRQRVLTLGAVPGHVGNSVSNPNADERIVLASGPGGHFTTSGSINGRVTQFLVDTGATSISIGQAEAERLSLQFLEGQRIMTQTANGPAPAHQIYLDSVRIGDVEVRNVEAIVIPGQMDYVLLGNSFLSRFQMRRDSDVLTLQLRY